MVLRLKTPAYCENASAYFVRQKIKTFSFKKLKSDSHLPI